MQRSAFSRVGSSLLAGALALAGCMQLLDIQGNVAVVVDAGEGSSSACGLVTSAPACQSCLDTHCCAQEQACAGEPACASYEACLVGCGADYACRARCVAQRASGSFPEIPPFDACLVAECETLCGVTCGLVAGEPVADAAVACETCIANGGCAAAEACGRSVGCGVVAQCVAGCLTLDCKEACEAADEAGAALLQAAYTPLEGTCATACAAGENWSCVGKVVVPTATAPQTVVTLTVTTLHGAVVAGAPVKACLLEDLSCALPTATATTDAQGVATLTVRGNIPGGNGFGGYFDVAPPDADAQPASIVPLLDFLTYPLSEPAASLSAVGLAPSDLATFKVLGGVDVADAGATGDLVLLALDCSLDLAPGVQLQASSGSLDLTPQLRYIAGEVPDPSATATDTSGIALLFGAPAMQDVVVASFPQQLGRTAGTFRAFTRAGAVSIVPVAPN